MRRRRRILLVCDVKGWGGWERATKIKEHLSDEFDFDMMDSTEFKEWEEKSDRHFIRVSELNHVLNRTMKEYTKQMIPIPEVLKFKEQKIEIQERPYDLYYMMFHTMLCSQEIKRVQYGGGKVFTAVTGAPVVKRVFANEGYGRKEEAFRVMSGKLEGIAANNLISYHELEEIYDGPKFYIPRGIDPDFWYDDSDYDNWAWGPDARLDRNDPYKQFTALFCGKKNSGKGLNRVIIPACHGVQPKRDVKLLTNERNYTDALSPEQMRKWYNQGHVYVVASETDGTPNTALEAAACGRPIISNYVGNMPEFIKDGWNGFLIKGNHSDTGEMAKQYREKLNFLKDNPEECREMGRNARKTVEENWTWEHSMKHERNALREILK